MSAKQRKKLADAAQSESRMNTPQTPDSSPDSSPAPRVHKFAHAPDPRRADGKPVEQPLCGQRNRWGNAYMRSLTIDPSRVTCATCLRLMSDEATGYG